MMQKRHQRFAAEEERVEDGDTVIKAEQFRGQKGTDISRSSGDQYMAFAHCFPSSCRVTLNPSTCRAGASLSVTTSIPCSRQVRRQISTTSPFPRMRTRSYPAF